MIEKIESIIKKVVGSSFAEASEGKDKKFLITASDKPEFGHYSTNVAFFVKESPEVIAKEVLRQAQELYGGSFFEKYEVKGKFINFWLTHDAIVQGVAEATSSKFKVQSSKLKINLEFISANPTGPLTMANGRGGFLGDALANVLEAAGNKVTREYYINDAGNQVRLLGESVLAALGKFEPGENHYQGGYVKELAKKLKNVVLRQAQELKRNLVQDINTEEIGREAAAILLKEIKGSLKNIGIEYDVWFSEYENLHKKGEIKKVLELLDRQGLIEKKDGATWLKAGDIADPRYAEGSGEASDKDRVLVKSAHSAGSGQAGQPTYFLADIAYHYDKLVKRKFDQAIDIWGADHHGYVARLKSGVKAIGADPSRLTIILTQLVRLMENGQEIKMSKRTGNFITMDELVEEVGADAARFFFLMHAPETHMDFDLALAKEKSQKNPVYYAQYAYVRCLSILDKFKVLSSKLKVSDGQNLKKDSEMRPKLKAKSLKLKVSDGQNLKKDSEIKLMLDLVKLPDLVWQTAQDYQISRLVRYALEVAKSFNNFYEKERVIIDDKNLMNARLGLVAATREVLAKVLDLLGISKPEKM